MFCNLKYIVFSHSFKMSFNNIKNKISKRSWALAISKQNSSCQNEQVLVIISNLPKQSAQNRLFQNSFMAWTWLRRWDVGLGFLSCPSFISFHSLLGRVTFGWSSSFLCFFYLRTIMVCVSICYALQFHYKNYGMCYYILCTAASLQELWYGLPSRHSNFCKWVLNVQLAHSCYNGWLVPS